MNFFTGRENLLLVLSYVGLGVCEWDIIIDFIFLSGRKMGSRQGDSVVINICRIKAMVIYTDDYKKME